MYPIISILGSIFRQIYLPNPFINLFSVQGIAVVFNIFIGGVIIGILSYILTGCVYESGDSPAAGSILYTFNYALISFSFYGISILIKNIILASILYIILYIVICKTLICLRDRQFYS